MGLIRLQQIDASQIAVIFDDTIRNALLNIVQELQKINLRLEAITDEQVTSADIDEII